MAKFGNNGYDDESYDAEPREVRSDFTIKLPSGQVIDLVTAEITKYPTKEKCLPVFVISGERIIGIDCPGCLNALSPERPLFFMDNGEFCYPCISCKDWVWWAGEEGWFYWLE